MICYLQPLGRRTPFNSGADYLKVYLSHAPWHYVHECTSACWIGWEALAVFPDAYPGNLQDVRESIWLPDCIDRFRAPSQFNPPSAGGWSGGVHCGLPGYALNVSFIRWLNNWNDAKQSCITTSAIHCYSYEDENDVMQLCFAAFPLPSESSMFLFQSNR